MRRRRVLAALALLATSGCAAAGTGRSLEPLVLDGEQVFGLTWEMSERGGRPVVFGRIENVSFYGTSRIQLLVDQLDPGGRTAAQQIAWVGTALRSGDHTFFEVPVPDRTATYRVRVFAFNRRFGTGGGGG